MDKAGTGLGKKRRGTNQERDPGTQGPEEFRNIEHRTGRDFLGHRVQSLFLQTPCHIIISTDLANSILKPSSQMSGFSRTSVL